MRKTLFTLAVATALMAGTIFTGCDSSEAKVEDAQKNVQDAKQDLKKAQKNADGMAKKMENAEEWKTFKSEAEEKIRNNEIRIAETREKMKTSGKTMDALYSKKIDLLEEKNKNLKARIDAYEKNHSEWESFKREFNHDMDELGQAFKDLTVDNKK